MLPLRCACVIVLAVWLTSDLAAAPAWTQIRAGNFLFLSDAPERELRDIVHKLDELRATVERAQPVRLFTASPVPTVVIVFSDDRGLRPYQPSVYGEVKNVAGYFQPGEDVNYIAMTRNGRALQVVFHEYLHFLIDNTEGETPTWFGEGLSQLYQTIDIDRKRGVAVIGGPPGGYLQLLKRNPPIELPELMEVSEPWSTFHDGNVRQLFYAESWALVHRLLIANPDGARQAETYLARLESGDRFDQAFTAAFGRDLPAMQAELGQYVRRFSSARVRVDLDRLPDGTEIPAATPADEDAVRAYLGDLLLRTGHIPDGRAMLNELLERNAGNAEAMAALGALALRGGRLDEGLQLLERAAALRPESAAIQTAFGTGLYDRAQRQWDLITPPEVFERPRDVLARAVVLDPSVAPAHLALGFAQLATGRFADAISSIGRAIELAPARKDYRLARARVLFRQREYDRAEAELRVLAARAPAGVRRAAAAMLEEMAGARGAAPSRFPAAPPTRAFASSGIPALRVLRNGEQDAMGRFVLLECQTAVPQYVVDTERGPLRLSGPVGGVQLIAYRNDVPGRIACGPLDSAPRVRVTFRPGDAGAPADSESPRIDGTVVAIEFLPDGFTPR